MTDKDKDIKIQFAPGAFDQFDGTQEELDALVSDIMQMFEGKTAEELLEMGRPMSEEDFEELPDDVKAQIARAHLEHTDEGEDLADEFKRKLQ
jgi:hypothetical protein